MLSNLYNLPISYYETIPAQVISTPFQVLPLRQNPLGWGNYIGHGASRRFGPRQVNSFTISLELRKE